MLQALRKLFTRSHVNGVQQQIVAAQLDKQVIEMMAKYSMSPDHQQLVMKDWHKVFVYNECQRGQSHFRELGLYVENLVGFGAETDVQYRGGAFTVDRYLLYKKKLGKETFPFAMIPQRIRGGEHGVFPHKVSGQLFLLRPHCLFNLDNYMLNTIQFERVRVPIQLRYHERSSDFGNHFGDQKIKITNAYMYVGKTDFWLDQIASQPERYGICKEYKTNFGRFNGLNEYYYRFYEGFENKN
jgi:hypothetical protein